MKLAQRPRWIVGLAFVVGLVALCVVAMGGVVKKLFPESGDTVVAVFSGTGSLAKGSPVRVRGVDAGIVEGIELDEGARTVSVTMKVYDAALPLHADARAAVKYRTVLGGNLAVEIEPGTRGTLDDATIPVSRTTNQVELDDVTAALGLDARVGLRSLISETPRALADPERPARTLSALEDASPPLRGAARAARGTRLGDLRALIANAAVLVRAVDRPNARVRALVADAGTTLRATAARQADIRASLQRAPATLAETQTTVQRLDRTLALADPLIAQLQDPADEIAPTVRVLRPVLGGADRLLADAVPLLRALRPAATDLASTARRAAPLLRDARPSIRRVADKILPSLDAVDPVSQRPTYQMIGPTFAGITGASAQFDREGNWFRFPALGGTNTINTLPCKEYITDPEMPGLVDCAALGDAINAILGTPDGGTRRGR